MKGRIRRRDIYGGGRAKGSFYVLLSYILDWVLLAAGAAIGYVLGELTPNRRPFSPADRSIAFPHYSEGTVPGWLLVVCCAVVPTIIIALVSLTSDNPGASGAGTSRSRVWKYKAWELHAGWIGLALSLITTWIITNGMKNMFGKPRPDMLARCEPDLPNLDTYLVGLNGPSSRGDIEALLVSADICTNPDRGTLDDGFRAFPSGHASLSAAGLVYLSLFLLTKLSITTPFLVFTIPTTTDRLAQQPPLPITYTSSASRLETPRPPVAHQPDDIPAQPLYLLLISLVPFFAALFIGGSRWFDFRHHGVDIVTGLLIGAATAVFAFYYYHMPIARGVGRAWGPRRAGRAFWSSGDGIGAGRDVVDHEMDGVAGGGWAERDRQVGKYAGDLPGGGTAQGSSGLGAARRQVSEDAVAEHAV